MLSRWIYVLKNMRLPMEFDKCIVFMYHVRNGIATFLPRNGGSRQCQGLRTLAPHAQWSVNVVWHWFSFCSLIYSNANKKSLQSTIYYTFPGFCAHLQFYSTKPTTASRLTPRHRNKYERNVIFTKQTMHYYLVASYGNGFHHFHAHKLI